MRKAMEEGDMPLQRRLQRYCAPRVLAIDEVGYLSYDHRHADLLFEVVTRRRCLRSARCTTFCRSSRKSSTSHLIPAT
jgi:DNA replication protein DnaC